MNVREIVIQYLREHGSDGLYHPIHDCGCWIDDLIPCDCNVECCVGGHMWPDPNSPDPDHPEMIIGPPRKEAENDPQCRPG